jgi:hypothetical protein
MTLAIVTPETAWTIFMFAVGALTCLVLVVIFTEKL